MTKKIAKEAKVKAPKKRPALVVVCFSKRDETKKPKVWGRYHLKGAEEASEVTVANALKLKIKLAPSKSVEAWMLKKRFSSENAAKAAADVAGFDSYTVQEIAQRAKNIGKLKDAVDGGK